MVEVFRSVHRAAVAETEERDNSASVYADASVVTGMTNPAEAVEFSGRLIGEQSMQESDWPHAL